MVKKKIVTLVNVDSLLGYAIAFRFLDIRKRDFTVRLLCHSKEGLDDLEALGGEIIQVKYDNEEKIKKTLEDTWLLLLIPEYSEKRLEYGNIILRSAETSKVNYIVLFSYIGVDDLHSDKIKEYKNLGEYKALEDKLEELYDDDSYCIIRIGFINQLLYYLGPMFEDRNEINLPVDQNEKWSTIDLGDIADATYNLSFTDIYTRSNQKNKTKNQTLFTFTPDNTITAIDVLEAANQGLNKNMTYSVVKQKALFSYLQKIRDDNRFRRRPLPLELLGKDRAYTFPLGKYLTDVKIETLLEWWRLADDGNTDVVTDDLQKSLKCPPQSIDQFFKYNSDQFRLLR